MKILRQFFILTLIAACFLFSAVQNTSAQETQISKNTSEKENAIVSEKDNFAIIENKEIENTTKISAPLPDYRKSLTNRTGIQLTDTTPLTLDEAIRKALENNNDIEVARSDVKIAETNLRSILGTYDGVFTISPTYQRNATTGQRATRDFRINSDFTKFISKGGGNYRVFFDNTRTENRFAQSQATQGGATTTGGALFSSGLGVTYNQPLLRDFKIDQTRRQIKVQKKRIAQSDADFRRQTIAIISQVQQSYWDLVFALRDQQNRIANLNLAKENLRRIEAQINAGSAAPLARAEVETELANRESDLILATQQVETTENKLKQLVLREPNSTEWTSQYLPTDTPVFSTDVIDLTLALKDAVENRPELRRLKLESEINKIDIDYFRNQIKPQIDLNTTASLGGISSSGAGVTVNSFPQFSGNEELLRQNLNLLLTRANLDTIPNSQIPIPATPGFLVGGFNQSLANLFRTDSPSYSVGVTISFPLRNQTAKANLAGARFQQERIEAQSRSQEQTVIAEVRNAVQAVEASRQRVFSSQRARENAEIQLEGERKLFDAGRSTTFLLFQRENALANARNAEIRAQTDYNKALSDLQRATSTTFRANNVEIESPLTNDQ
ncbi:MAG: TolC family protein [Pyrinomonadaceae bacterium]